MPPKPRASYRHAARASVDTLSSVLEPQRVLLSYWMHGKQPLSEYLRKYLVKPYPDVFVDSGAYSAYTLGGSISVDEYAAWLHEGKSSATVYANLDAIGDAARTWEHQNALESNGLAPLPVYHAGEPWSFFSRYLERYPYIALGGVVGAPVKKLLPWLVKCFEMGRVHGTRFHGFGVTAWPILRALPFYSVDSTAWFSGTVFGTVRLFDATRGEFVTFPARSPALTAPHAALIREHGGDPALLADAEQYSYRYPATLQAVSWRVAEGWLRRWHGPISPPVGHEGRPGVRVYLASSSGVLHQGAQRALARYALKQRPRLGLGPLADDDPLLAQAASEHTGSFDRPTMRHRGKDDKHLHP